MFKAHAHTFNVDDHFHLEMIVNINVIIGDRQRRLEPETKARDLGCPRAICAMLGMQSEVCNRTLYHR